MPVVLVARVISHQLDRRDFKNRAIALDVVRFRFPTDRPQQFFGNRDANSDPSVPNVFRYGAIPASIEFVAHVQFNTRRSQISADALFCW